MKCFGYTFAIILMVSGFHKQKDFIEKVSVSKVFELLNLHIDYLDD